MLTFFPDSWYFVRGRHRRLHLLQLHSAGLALRSQAWRSEARDPQEHPRPGACHVQPSAHHILSVDGKCKLGRVCCKSGSVAHVLQIYERICLQAEIKLSYCIDCQ